MTETKGQNWQDVQESALAVIGAPARSTNELILSKFNLHANFPSRMYAALTPDSKLYFEASAVEVGDGAVRSVAPADSTLTASPQGNLNYQLITSMVTGITLTLEGGAYSHPVAAAAGRFVVGAFSRKKNGSYNCKYSAIQTTLGAAQAIDLGTLFGPIGGMPVGYIYLESTDNAGRWKTAGSTTSIIENKTASTNTIGRIQAGVDLDYFQTQITSLQTQIDTINNTMPLEEYYECLSAGHRVYTVSGFVFNASTSVKDIQVFRNMGRLKSPKDYVKLSTTSIQLTFDPVITDEILIDKRT